ncbi:MAG: Alpha/beta fold family hydrolase [Candidatus Pacebacteria bacterium GW2011_GWB1_47_8]|nr:MAG: Alpha/beta fold family hydrolase [Candidatus Pacebacteria bacterium GW2011_GWA1_46_10]KKU84494.1 MAG: Alpha/beta fold family hydrolase [Candidatus Pacebacteria bacterium GW2011_GWB1_47_8]HCR81443.1 alpha/beta hydrolase [Candidatus Paceibacterota bacterium]
MKNALILHGTSCTPQSFWQPSIKSFLESKGYEVIVPQLPEADTPDLEKWLPVALDFAFNEESILIGHSAGSPLVLSVLENINTQIHKAILVAGYARPKGEKKDAEHILQKKYNWEEIKNNVKDLIFINSDNDPWGCDHKEGLYMWEHLGGTLILREGEGHMGTETYNQPYTKFPLLEKLLELRYTRSSIDGTDKK